MKSKTLVTIIGISILTIIAGLFLFTDIFTPKHEKFLEELEYYENLRYDTNQLSIEKYEDWDSENFFGTLPELIRKKVSKNEFRKIVSRSTSYGVDLDTFWDTNKEPPDLCYDNTRLILWVEEWSSDYEERYIYYWSPRG